MARTPQHLTVNIQIEYSVEANTDEESPWETADLEAAYLRAEIERILDDAPRTFKITVKPIFKKVEDEDTSA